MTLKQLTPLISNIGWLQLYILDATRNGYYQDKLLEKEVEWKGIHNILVNCYGNYQVERISVWDGVAHPSLVVTIRKEVK